MTLTPVQDGGSPAVVIITGAGGDIGGAVARALAPGWTVALFEHPDRAPALDVTRAQCADLGAATWTGTFDVTDQAAATDVVNRCVADLGPPGALFNNAGLQGPFERIDRYPVDAARTVFEVNVLGAFVVMSCVAATMVAAGSGGSIVCSGSMAGVTGAPNMSAYSASKAAIVAMAKSAAKDLAPFGIRVNAVSPAFIGPGRMWDAQVEGQAAAASPYYADDPARVAEQMIGSVPLGRYGSIDEVAAVVRFLVSAEASYLTGVNVEVAGGAA